MDDLPLAGAASRGDAAARRATTEALLAVLKKHRIPAIAFVIAGNVKTPDDEALLQRWLDEGHEIGSHSHTHPSHTALTSEAYLADRRVVADGALGLAGAAPAHARGSTGSRTCRKATRRRRSSRDARRARRRPRAQRAGHARREDWSFDRRWADAVASGDAAAIDDVRQDYLAAVRVAVTRTETLADRLLGRPAPQVLLIHANGVGAANWDAMFTWLAAHGHRFATADEVLADDTFRDLPIDPGRWGYGHYHRLAKLRRAAEARAELVSVLQTQAAAWNRGDLEAFCSVYAANAAFASPSGLTRGRDAVLARYRDKVPGCRGARHAVVRDRGDRAGPGLEVTPFNAPCPATSTARRCWPAGR